MSTRISIDVGFSGLKVATLTDGVLNYYKEQNAICDLGTSNYDAYSGREKDIVAFKGHHYIVGKSALKKPNVVKIDSYESMRDISPIVATKVLQGYNPEDVEYICFALSSAFLDRSKDFHTYLAESLPEYKGKIKLIPQGAACKRTIDFVGLDVENTSVKDSFSTYILIDLGFNTIDCASVINGALLPCDIKGYEHTGAILIAEEVQKQIKSKYDLDLPIETIKSILEDKTLKVRAETYDCTEIVQKAIELYLEVLRDFLEKNYKNEMNTITNVILMGGGAEIIRDNMDQWKEYYGEGFMIMPKVRGSATFFNAIGGLYINK